MDLLLTDRQGLQGIVAGVAGPLHPFVSLSGPECAGQLGEGEDPLTVIPLQFLLAHTPEQADVVGLDRLRATLLLKLADLTVAVQHESRRLTSVPEPPQFPDDLLCLPVELRVQPNFPQPGVRAAG